MTASAACAASVSTSNHPSCPQPGQSRALLTRELSRETGLGPAPFDPIQPAVLRPNHRYSRSLLSRISSCALPCLASGACAPLAPKGPRCSLQIRTNSSTVSSPLSAKSAEDRSRPVPRYARHQPYPHCRQTAEMKVDCSHRRLADVSRVTQASATWARRRFTIFGPSWRIWGRDSRTLSIRQQTTARRSYGGFCRSRGSNRRCRTCLTTSEASLWQMSALGQTSKLRSYRRHQNVSLEKRFLGVSDVSNRSRPEAIT
jgi:hypothetical protein